MVDDGGRIELPRIVTAPHAATVVQCPAGVHSRPAVTPTERAVRVQSSVLTASFCRAISPQNSDKLSPEIRRPLPSECPWVVFINRSTEELRHLSSLSSPFERRNFQISQNYSVAYPDYRDLLICYDSVAITSALTISEGHRVLGWAPIVRVSLGPQNVSHGVTFGGLGEQNFYTPD